MAMTREQRLKLKQQVQDKKTAAYLKDGKAVVTAEKARKVQPCPDCAEERLEEMQHGLNPPFSEVPAAEQPLAATSLQAAETLMQGLREDGTLPAETITPVVSASDLREATGGKKKSKVPTLRYFCGCERPIREITDARCPECRNKVRREIKRDPLPHGSTIAASYDAEKWLWTGRLMISLRPTLDDPDGETLEFTRQDSGVFHLLTQLDDAWRKYLDGVVQEKEGTP
jgi:endogenous inhibitor of DNA gyrase (YacG/DUF329 family)